MIPPNRQNGLVSMGKALSCKPRTTSGGEVPLAGQFTHDVAFGEAGLVHFAVPAPTGQVGHFFNGYEFFGFFLRNDQFAQAQHEAG